MHEPRADRRARARRRAAGDATWVPRIARRPEIRIVPGRAVGELGHVQRAEPESSRRPRAARSRSTSPARSSPRAPSSRSRPACLPSSTYPCGRAARHAADPSARDVASARSAALAAASASSASTRTKALSAGCHCSIRASKRLRQLDRRQLAAPDRCRDFLEREFRGIAHRPISSRCTATKVDGSVSNAISIFSAAKRAIVGPVARAMRAADPGASGTRAACGHRCDTLGGDFVRHVLPP